MLQKSGRELARGRGRQGEQEVRLSLLVRELPPELRDTALTHSSWVDDRAKSYERLEFLGDSVLGLALAAALYQRFPQATEGELARFKAFSVSRASCAQVAMRLQVVDALEERARRLGADDRVAKNNPMLLGNVLEALIGAVFLTHGFERTREAVVEAFEPQIDYAVRAHVDHKTTLQEILATRGLQPQYRLVREDGPPHARVFTSEVLVDGVVLGRGAGTTIKGSEQAAAREALTSLGAEPAKSLPGGDAAGTAAGGLGGES